MKWFQVKEVSAGKKRLILSWYLYKIFGKNVLYLIAWFVSLFTFIFAKKVRTYSKKYLTVIRKVLDVDSGLIGQFRHIRSYADSLVDKILVYSGEFNIGDVEFCNQKEQDEIFDTIAKSNGVVFLCNHIGNIEALYTFFRNEKIPSNFSINIVISKKQSQVFNGFLEQIKTEIPVNLFPIEEMGIETGMELEEKLDNGGVLFIAGDRVSQTNDNQCVESELFSRKILLPKGAFKLVKTMNRATYFVSAIKQDKKYLVYSEKQASTEEKSLTSLYTKFMEKMIMKAPYQFYHFYDFFN